MKNLKTGAIVISLLTVIGLAVFGFAGPATAESSFGGLADVLKRAKTPAAGDTQPIKPNKGSYSQQQAVQQGIQQRGLQEPKARWGERKSARAVATPAVGSLFPQGQGNTNNSDQAKALSDQINRLNFGFGR